MTNPLIPLTFNYSYSTATGTIAQCDLATGRVEFATVSSDVTFILEQTLVMLGSHGDAGTIACQYVLSIAFDK